VVQLAGGEGGDEDGSETKGKIMNKNRYYGRKRKKRCYQKSE
jgi:hypothetical protein